MQPPIFMESRKPKSTTVPVVSAVTATQPFSCRRGEAFSVFSGTGGLFPRTQAPLPVTVQVAESGRWFHSRAENEIHFSAVAKTGCGAEDMCTVTGCDGHGSERKGLTDRGAGTIQPIKRNPHISNAKRRCDRLCKKIPGKCHSDTEGLRPAFPIAKYSSFFLESAFCVFPGICPEAWIFAHHIKTVSERSFAFFLPTIEAAL